jgi:hypothetical protein
LLDSKKAGVQLALVFSETPQRGPQFLALAAQFGSEALDGGQQGARVLGR